MPVEVSSDIGTLVLSEGAGPLPSAKTAARRDSGLCGLFVPPLITGRLDKSVDKAKRQKLEAYIDHHWVCQATALPLVFGPTFCLLERLVSCTNGKIAERGFGYYNLRESFHTSPLLALLYPHI